MPGYENKHIDWYGHFKPPKAQYTLHKWSLPCYDVAPQIVQRDNTVTLPWVLLMQNGFTLSGRAVEPSILPALTDILYKF